MDHLTSGLGRARRALESSGRFPGGALPGDIADSWTRSLPHGLDPLARPEAFVLTQAAFASVRQRHADLIHFARPELELLFDQIAGSNFMIALGTADGVVLDTLIDTQFADIDAGRSVIPGSIWTEDLRGTNAFSLCLSAGRPAQVYGGERFLRAHQDVSCISAPIFDGQGGIAAVLDASSGSAIRQQHTAALVQMAADNIENSLIRQGHDSGIVVLFHPRPEYLGTLSAGMPVLDDELRIHAVNRKGSHFLTSFGPLIGADFAKVINTDFQAVTRRLLMPSQRARCAPTCATGWRGSPLPCPHCVTAAIVPPLPRGSRAPSTAPCVWHPAPSTASPHMTGPATCTNCAPCCHAPPCAPVQAGLRPPILTACRAPWPRPMMPVRPAPAPAGKRPSAAPSGPAWPAIPAV